MEIALFLLIMAIGGSVLYVWLRFMFLLALIAKDQEERINRRKKS